MYAKMVKTYILGLMFCYRGGQNGSTSSTASTPIQAWVQGAIAKNRRTFDGVSNATINPISGPSSSMGKLLRSMVTTLKLFLLQARRQGVLFVRNRCSVILVGNEKWVPYIQMVVAKSSNVYPKDAEAPPCGVDDMTKLAYLHEPGVLNNSRPRYDINEIYVVKRCESIVMTYKQAISRRASLYEMIRDYGQAAKDLHRLVSLLTTQVEKGAVSGASDNLSCINELKQTQIQLSNVEMESRKGIPLNAYLILGVDSTASAADIKKAYRKAALKHHPDKVVPNF
ncbi:putative DnaJ domain, Chaperone J-domain superfamily, kinesin motor domain superfamily [Helianthus anomalus]